MGEAARLLDRARQSPHGWSARELEALMTQYDFVPEDGGKHRRYVHCRYPDIRMSVTRSSGDISSLYVRDAVKRIAMVQARDASR